MAQPNNKKKAITAILTNISRLLLAAVLITSGFVKAVDPQGLTYKLQEYLAAFGIDLLSEEWLLCTSLLLSAAEFVIGVFLLMGVYSRVTTWLAFIFFMLFTPFTLVLMLLNPVRDCGCFGDAFHMSNEATFAKNMLLLVFATMACFRRRLFVRRVSTGNRWMVALFAISYIALVEATSLAHLPVLDFRPFAVNTNLREAVQDIPSEKQTIYKFEKDGEVAEFNDSNYPDSTWNYLGSRTVIIKEGHPAAISDFAFIDNATGDDHAPAILADSGYVFLLAINNPETADESRVDKINEIYDLCTERGIPMFAATSSDDSQASLWRKRTGAEYPILWADETMLKTMIRSNPGLLLIKDGIITGKWNIGDVPPVEEFDQSPTRMPDAMPSIYSYIRGIKPWALLFAIPLGIIIIIDLLTARRGKKQKSDNRAHPNDKNSENT